MKIDKSKLKMGIWYEDRDKNVLIPEEMDQVDPPSHAETFHALFPFEITERIYAVYDKSTPCRHSIKNRKRIDGLVKGLKGCRCLNCGREKIGKTYIPFIFMPWKYGAITHPLGSFNTHISRRNEDLILSMANSGDFTLSEAIVILASSCERCSNVLAYKYTNGKEGYPEYSEEWKKANTTCDFCYGCE